MLRPVRDRSPTANFDFLLYPAFRSACAVTSSEGFLYELNVSGTEYLARLAPGMLTLPGEYAGGEASRIDTIELSDDVGKILHVANIGRLFNI